MHAVSLIALNICTFKIGHIAGLFM